MTAAPERSAGASAPSSPPPRRPLWRRMLGFPGTRIGWWAVGLACTFSAFFALLQILVATGQRGGDTFFANPWLGLTMLAAVVAAMAGGVAAAVAIFWKRERSLLAFAALLIGFLVGLLVVLVLLAPASE